MSRLLQGLRARLPEWVIDWLDLLIPVAQAGLILLVAWLLYRLARRIIQHLIEGRALPGSTAVVARRSAGFLIYGGALLWGLELFGVSGTVLWTAFTSFAAVGAVAFFAAWSVLSNIFCAFLIFTTRIFWPGDTIEVLENGDKPGLKGRVLDINLVFTTLEESGGMLEGTTLRVPNSMFFQRVVRRWHGNAPKLPPQPGRAADPAAAANGAAPAPAPAPASAPAASAPAEYGA